MKTIEVGGMHCANCSNSVTKTLSALPGLSNVSVDLAKGLVTFEGEASEDTIKAAIDAIGFVPGAIK